MTEKSPLEILKRSLKKLDEWATDEVQTYYFFFEDIDAIKAFPTILSNIFDNKELVLLTSDKELESFVNNNLKNIQDNNKSYIIYDLSHTKNNNEFLKNMNSLYGFWNFLKQTNIMILVPPQYAPGISSFYYYTHRTASYSQMDQEVINEVNIIKMKEKLEKDLSPNSSTVLVKAKL